VATDTADAVPSESDRGNALFRALDTDGDGTVTKEEFVEGAEDLLRRAGRNGRRHHHGRGIEDGERGHHQDHSRLTRRLERLFELVDANGDGDVERAELSSALQRPRHTHKSARTSASTQETPQAVTDPSSATVSHGLRTRPTVASATAPTTADRDGSSVNAKDKQPQAATASVEPPAGSSVTITQITITVAIQQYTTASVGGQTAPFSTLSAAA
jgi:hypothetical protein